MTKEGGPSPFFISYIILVQDDAFIFIADHWHTITVPCGSYRYNTCSQLMTKENRRGKKLKLIISEVHQKPEKMAMTTQSKNFDEWPPQNNFCSNTCLKFPITYTLVQFDAGGRVSTSTHHQCFKGPDEELCRGKMIQQLAQPDHQQHSL